MRSRWHRNSTTNPPIRFTFVQGKGRVLLVDNTDPSHSVDSAKFLRQALANEKINLVSITPEQFPNNPIELAGI